MPNTPLRRVGESPDVGPPDQRVLLERIRAGDPAALDALLDRYWTSLVTYAEPLVQGWDAAEDVVLETFVRIWERREEWDIHGSVCALLYRITRNLALDERKRRDRYAKRIHDQPKAARRVTTPSEELQMTELEAGFERAVAALPERRREVFLLARTQNLSYRQIAEAMGIAPQTVANQLSAALADLRDSLDPFLDSSAARPIRSSQRAQPYH